MQCCFVVHLLRPGGRHFPSSESPQSCTIGQLILQDITCTCRKTHPLLIQNCLLLVHTGRFYDLHTCFIKPPARRCHCKQFTNSQTGRLNRSKQINAFHLHSQRSLRVVELQVWASLRTDDRNMNLQSSAGLLQSHPPFFHSSPIDYYTRLSDALVICFQITRAQSR